MKNFSEKEKKLNFCIYSIRLRNIKESIAGFYTCEVSNGFETLTSTGFVRVKNPGIEYYFLFIIIIFILL